MFKFWLPNAELRTKKVEVPGLDCPIALNMVPLKGITALDVVQGDTASIWADRHCKYDRLGSAEIYEIKHMILGDLARYKELTRNYYHNETAGKSYHKLKKDMMTQYDGIIDGEIVTAVFFIPKQDLIESIHACQSTIS